MNQAQATTLNHELARAAKLVADGAYAEAERLLRSIVAAAPDHARAWHELGNACFRGGAFDRAAEAYARRLNLEPGNALANYSLGAALAEAGRADEARPYLQRALQLRPDFPQAARRLAHPGPESPTAGTAERVPADRHDPGCLIMAGRPRLSSFVGRFVLVAVLAALSIGVGLVDAPHDRSLVRSLSGITELEDRYAYVRQQFPDDAGARGDAKQDIASREDAVDAAFAVVGWGLLVAALLLALHALGAAAMTRYHVYERRIDVEHGGIRRVAYSVWLWDVTDAEYRRPPGLLLTNTAQIALSTRHTDRPVRVTGLASAREMRALWAGIRARAFARQHDVNRVRGGFRP